MDLETIATLVTVVAAAVGVAVANARAIRGLRLELKGDIAELRTELKADIAKLDDRVYALAAGLAPRLEPASGTDT